MALRFLHSQLFVTPPVPTTSFANRTVIVTGSNTGLGLEAARHFTRLGASTVILAVRALSRGEAARASIEASTGRLDVVRVMHLDMSSYESVLSFAATVSKECERVDVVLLNAGVNRGTWEVFESHESTLTVNVFSTLLLAQALLPKMQETSRKFNTSPALSMTGSEVHEFAQFPEKHAPLGQIFAQLDAKKKDGKDVDLGNRYQLSKLLQLLCARALAVEAATASSNVTISTANPGLCKSELSRESGWGMWVLELLLARTAEVGSRSLVSAAGMGAEAHGKYVSDGIVADVAAWVESEEGKEVQERVWKEVKGEIDGVLAMKGTA